MNQAFWLSFGRPVLDRLGVRTAVVLERFMAGDDIDQLARDYDALPEAAKGYLAHERQTLEAVVSARGA